MPTCLPPFLFRSAQEIVQCVFAADAAEGNLLSIVDGRARSSIEAPSSKFGRADRGKLIDGSALGTWSNDVTDFANGLSGSGDLAPGSKTVSIA